MESADIVWTAADQVLLKSLLGEELVFLKTVST